MSGRPVFLDLGTPPTRVRACTTVGAVFVSLFRGHNVNNTSSPDDSVDKGECT